MHHRGRRSNLLLGQPLRGLRLFGREGHQQQGPLAGDRRRSDGQVVHQVHPARGGGKPPVGEHQLWGNRVADRALAEIVEAGPAVGDLPEHPPFPGVDVVGEFVGQAGSLSEFLDDGVIAFDPLGRRDDRARLDQPVVPIRPQEIILFQQRGGGQHVVGAAGRIGEEAVDHHGQLPAGERLGDRVRLREHRHGVRRGHEHRPHRRVTRFENGRSEPGLGEQAGGDLIAAGE